MRALIAKEEIEASEAYLAKQVCFFPSRFRCDVLVGKRERRNGKAFERKTTTVEGTETGMGNSI
jgi:hypothetical protein